MRTILIYIISFYYYAIAGIAWLLTLIVVPYRLSIGLIFKLSSVWANEVIKDFNEKLVKFNGKNTEVE